MIRRDAGRERRIGARAILGTPAAPVRDVVRDAAIDPAAIGPERRSVRGEDLGGVESTPRRSWQAASARDSSDSDDATDSRELAGQEARVERVGATHV
jgi:hypothetical protein